MGENSKIEWTNHTFNPWVGCTKISPACDNCYAESWAKRSGRVEWGPHAKRRRASDSYWYQPKKWNRLAERDGARRKVFCASLADVFDNQAQPSWRAELFDLIFSTPNLDWLLLTKRPQNIRDFLPSYPRGEVWPNIWLGTTAENPDEYRRRWGHLASIPARIRFLSAEPLLADLGDLDLGRVGAPNWVICGGESGPKARPMHPDWARSLRDQCQAAGVPFFFKQWGEFDLSYDRDRDDPDWRRCDREAIRSGQWINLAGGQGFHGERVHYARRVGKKIAGALLDGKEWREMPG